MAAHNGVFMILVFRGLPRFCVTMPIGLPWTG